MNIFYFEDIRAHISLNVRILNNHSSLESHFSSLKVDFRVTSYNCWISLSHNFGVSSWITKFKLSLLNTHPVNFWVSRLIFESRVIIVEYPLSLNFWVLSWITKYELSLLIQSIPLTSLWCQCHNTLIYIWRNYDLFFPVVVYISYNWQKHLSRHSCTFYPQETAGSTTSFTRRLLAIEHSWKPGSSQGQLRVIPTC